MRARRVIRVLAAVPGACAWGLGILWLRRLDAALVDPEAPLPGLVNPFLSMAALAAVGGAFLLAAKGPPRWRVPAGLLCLVPLPAAAGVFCAVVAPHVPLGPISLMGKFLDSYRPPFSRHAVDEDLWSAQALRYVVLTSDGRVFHRGEDGLDAVRRAAAGDPGLFRLAADKETPWQHVEWVLRALHEEGLDRITFDARCAHHGAPHDARMPLPLVLGGDDGDALQVEVVPRKETEGRWNGEPVWRPTEFAYRFGGETTPDLTTLAARLSAAARGRGPVAGRVRASPRVPVKAVLAAASVLLDAGMERWVADVPPPIPDNVRSAGTYREPLPYPR